MEKDDLDDYEVMWTPTSADIEVINYDDQKLAKQVYDLLSEDEVTVQPSPQKPTEPPASLDVTPTHFIPTLSGTHEGFPLSDIGGSVAILYTDLMRRFIRTGGTIPGDGLCTDAVIWHPPVFEDFEKPMHLEPKTDMVSPVSGEMNEDIGKMTDFSLYED
ncbi:unnamed protein product [Dibothriocephalus latus]|uniref:Uncharacterized protein n=1 Tax=Dibothriocephalus latus TaxID=60516 RepID=A0A3P7P241_DIBLA|nr:unnamed protein product [Dibothriocephalus latus]